MDEPRSVTEYLERAWSQALLTVSAAEEEASRWVGRWAGAAGWGPEEVRKHASDWAERLVGQRRELEHFVEEGVRKAVGRMRIPKREEVQELERKMNALVNRLEKLTQKSA
jgi:ubiquinone biosynthesis protein UbiJ